MGLIDDTLAEILVCPNDKGRLREDEDRSVLWCKDCGLGFPVRGDNGAEQRLIIDVAAGADAHPALPARIGQVLVTC